MPESSRKRCANVAVARKARDLHVRHDMNIKELMTTQVVAIGPHATLDVAARKMWDAECGVLPVVDSDRHVVGILTDRDICMAAWTRARLLTTIHVDEAMSKQVFALSPEQDVIYAEQMMAAKQVRRVPIVDSEGRLVGIVSLGDLARHAACAGDDERGAHVIDALAAIGHRARFPG